MVGRQIKLDDDLFTVIGVMPRWFENVLAPGGALGSLAIRRFASRRRQGMGSSFTHGGQAASGWSVEASHAMSSMHSFLL